MEMPTLLPYPKIRNFKEVPTLNGVFCYIVNDYAPGYAMTIKRAEDNAHVQIGGWDGVIKENLVDYSKHISTLLGVMKYAGIPQLEFYFDSNDKIIDIRESFNKFASPGMVRDLFEKCVGVQSVLEIAIMTDEKIKFLEDSGKSYIIKPSRYRHYTIGDELLPMYGRI